MAAPLLPCGGCGHEIPPERLKKKLIPKSKFIILAGQRCDGYYATCGRCGTKMAFEQHYVEEELKLKP